jgi:hypothetical protein
MYCHLLTVAGFMTLCVFGTVASKFNVAGMCTSGNYTHKRVTKADHNTRAV